MDFPLQSITTDSNLLIDSSDANNCESVVPHQEPIVESEIPSDLKLVSAEKLIVNSNEGIQFIGKEKIATKNISSDPIVTCSTANSEIHSDLPNLLKKQIPSDLNMADLSRSNVSYDGESSHCYDEKSAQKAFEIEDKSVTIINEIAVNEFEAANETTQNVNNTSEEIIQVETISDLTMNTISNNSSKQTLYISPVSSVELKEITQQVTEDQNVSCNELEIAKSVEQENSAMPKYELDNSEIIELSSTTTNDTTELNDVIIVGESSLPINSYSEMHIVEGSKLSIQTNDNRTEENNPTENLPIAVDNSHDVCKATQQDGNEAPTLLSIDRHTEIKENDYHINNTNAGHEQIFIIHNEDFITAEKNIVTDQYHLQVQQGVELDKVRVEESSDNLEDNIEFQLQKIDQGPNDKITSEIPSHVLGRNAEHPLKDKFRNGKIPPKPRLGVKVPYMNLTSQIVTKQEIVNEVMKRQRTNPEKDSGRNTLFAKKLTHTLARKIVPVEGQPELSIPTSSTSREREAPYNRINPFAKDEEKIENNSDLLAILEGDDEDIKVSEPNNEQHAEFASLKDLEKQIALKQLHEMREPRLKHNSKDSKHNNLNLTSSNSKLSKSSTVDIETTYASSMEQSGPQDKNEINIPQNIEVQIKKKSNFEKKLDPQPNTIVKDVDISNKCSPKPITMKNKEEPRPDLKTEMLPKCSDRKQNRLRASRHDLNTKGPTKLLENETKLRDKTNITSLGNKISENVGIVVPNTNTSDTKEDIHTIPKFSSKLVVKTYTRKRKQPEERLLKKSSNTGGVTEINNSNIYITKSSRVIKKKIIWDPHEALPRAPIKSHKHVDQAKECTTSMKKPQKTLTLKSSSRSQINSFTGTEEIKTIKCNTLTPIKKPISDKPRRLTEVDKLLMDEGAVNMLYAVKNTDENASILKNKKKPMVISLDKAQRELMNRTNEIKNDLQISTHSEISPKSLRKKEVPSTMKVPKKIIHTDSTSRHKSKDSNRSSVHSPPPSPAMVYPNPEASRIIRRHSSSSYSTDEEETLSEICEKEENRQRESKKTIDGAVRKRHSIMPNAIIKHKRSKKAETEKRLTKDLMTNNEFKNLTIKVMDHLFHIIISPANQQFYFTCEVLQEVTDAIQKLNKDNNCNVILISSAGNTFCSGLDYKTLVADDEHQRIELAKELAIKIRKFLWTLAVSSKILIAGVHGNVEGLGVMMLPLFDMVIASDTSTFSTAYGRLGCAPEGGCLVTLPHLMNNVLISELLLSPRKVIASEAQRIGLVTRILWPDKFQDELVTSTKIVAKQPIQFLEVAKKLSNQKILKRVHRELELETDILIKHWTSEECQKSFCEEV